MSSGSVSNVLYVGSATAYGTFTSTSGFVGVGSALTSLNAANMANGSVTNTEFQYLDGATSAIQTQIAAKQPTITGGATTITSSDLTINRALLSDGSGKVAVSAVTNTELGYVGGVTSAIQTQLDGKAGSSNVILNQNTLQSGTTFYVSSGSVSNVLYVGSATAYGTFTSTTGFVGVG
ncbi:MAG: hypothetical protein AAB772_02750, partial [Patescibacteria group bacterium]